MWTFFAGERSRCGSAEGGEKLRKTNDQKILGSLSSPGKILKNIFVIKDDHKKFFNATQAPFSVSPGMEKEGWLTVMVMTMTGN